MKGKIIRTTSDVYDIKFDSSFTPQMGTLAWTETSKNYLMLERALGNGEFRAVVIMKGAGIIIGEDVTTENKFLQAPVGAEALGRVYNVLGQPIDGLPLNNNTKFADVYVYQRKNKRFITKQHVLRTGIKAIDFFLPSFKGDKIGIFGGAGVGKTLVIKEIINNTIMKNNDDSKNVRTIIAGIGERSREGEELYTEIKEAKLLDKVMLYFAQMNETPGARMKLIYSAITSAEYFRDVSKEDTIMFIDNIYRFVQAGSELSASLGNIPSESGYQPTLMTEISNVQERLSNTADGTITTFQTVFVPADDITDPSTVGTFSHLDSSFVLDREIAASGRYPAIDILQSNSTNLSADKISDRHLRAVKEAKRHIQKFKELEYIIAILGKDGLSNDDLKIVERARLLLSFFTQNLFMAEEYTQRKGDFVLLEDTIESVESILRGELDKYDPSELLYISTVKNFLQEKEKATQLVEQTNFDPHKKVTKSSLRRNQKKMNKEMKELEKLQNSEQKAK